MNLTRWKSPPLRGETVGDFRHGNLRSMKTGIRLAQLLPGSGNKGIAINLVDSFVSGSGQIPYDALSYTWGAGERNKTIICNGKRMYVTQTLLEALHRFRDHDHITTLWIDQICICQERLRERNQQVQMMGDIFKGARKVIVWLGDEYDNSRAGMQLAKQLLSVSRYQQVSGLGPADLECHGLPRLGHKRWKALAAILRRPWFWRTWIVQEVVLNPHVELVLGSSILTWDELESIVALLEGPMPRKWQLDQAISASELPFSRINRIRLRHQRLIMTPITPSKPAFGVETLKLAADPGQVALEDDDGDDPELLDLLLMSRGLGATDPRDKIYALLGLGKHNINPDYSISAESVFTDFALQTIGFVTNKAAKLEADGVELSPHDREVRRAMILLACAGRQNQRLKLPSWVPDWTINLASRPLVFGLGARYSAGGSKLGDFDWNPESGCLELSGVLLDTVQYAGTILLESNDGRDPHELIAAWWKEAKAIALERIARSPGSTAYTDAFEAMRRRLSLCKHGYYIGESHGKHRSALLDDADLSADASHSWTQTLTLGPTRGRVLFASSTGYVGLVPYGTKPGDLVFVIRGAEVLFVLRPHQDAYELIGEAYVQGVMDGEALGMTHLLPEDVRIR
ncbi:Hypothetical protein R9X50_00357900 [Acrodontium crateriforme]|uniref:Heterokaryon incompatibility domain-containing protein n=1 Tax=Acrodontium crateriforme TaxID=150365 RepID=A0AAQ3R7K6_9PEZI|nr:Hypothetical protein R9X50_00357900 [Acrodontium crateriforme]